MRVLRERRLAESRRRRLLPVGRLRRRIARLVEQRVEFGELQGARLLRHLGRRLGACLARAERRRRLAARDRIDYDLRAATCELGISWLLVGYWVFSVLGNA